MNESIEFDLKVNGKEAKTSINDVEKAQDFDKILGLAKDRSPINTSYWKQEC